MRKEILALCLALGFLGTTSFANAQDSGDVLPGRPVWLVGHACNSERCLENVIEDGGCGVEIDVDTDANNKDSFWSVNHGGFITRKTMDSRNAYRNPGNYYVSLEEYLNFGDMDNIIILWLDVKEGGSKYLKELVTHVHSILKVRYGSPENAPYSIIYGLYSMDSFEVMVGNEKTIDWLKRNLCPNEGINLACEGKSSGKYATDSLPKLEKYFVNEHDFPIGRHFMTCGWGVSGAVNKGTIETVSLLEAKKLRDANRYCSRTGFWTSCKYSDVIWFIDPDWAGVHTDCDLILADCRSDFNIPFITHHDALQRAVNDYFNPKGTDYKKYNKGKCRLAVKGKDKFYK